MNGDECEICGTRRDLINRFACRREHPQAEALGFDRECDERAILKLRGEVSMLEQELRQYRSEEAENITITLSGYERANLLWYLGLIGYGDEPPLEPFTFCNTGDWVGMLWWKVIGKAPPQLKPNVSREALADRIAAWRAKGGKP